MEITNLENTMNVMMPVAVKFLFQIGVAIALSGIIIGIYKVIKKKNGFRYMGYTVVLGALMSISALLVDFVAKYIIDYSSCKWQIPSATIIGLILYTIGMNLMNKSLINKEKPTS